MPDKVLLPFYKNQSILDILVKKIVSHTSLPIVIATTTNPSLVLSNAIEINNIPLRKVPPIIHNEINMCISIGASNNTVFGLDRLAKSIKHYKGNVKFKVYVAGILKDVYLNELNSITGKETFFFEGMLNPEGLNELYSKCHVAFAALAMFRLDANYSSSLKVKEYLAAGIPFFLAYTEPVLKNIDNIEGYYFVFENNETLLDMNKIVDFVSSFSNDLEHPVKVRENSYKDIDYKNRAKELDAFLKQLKDPVR